METISSMTHPIPMRRPAGRAWWRQAAGLLPLAALSLVGLTGCGSEDSAAPPPAAPARVATITTVAGTGIAGISGDGALAIGAQLNNPSGVAVNAAGDIWIADTLNNRIRKVDAAGVITTVAGTGIAGISGDGALAIAAQLNTPRSVAVDAAGTLWIADFINHRIRKVDTAGVITTVAGTGTAGFNGDNQAATAAQLNGPIGVAVDAAGTLWIAEFSNQRIRKVDTAGIITTVAGTGTAGFNGDNQAATAAQLNAPTGVAVDAAGTLWIADTTNQRIRKVGL